MTAGGDKVADLGKKVPIVQTETGAVRQMNVRVGPVRKALACIAEMCDHGHRVVFDNDGSFILDKSSGETIPLHRQHKTYTFKVKVLKPDYRPKKPEATLAPLDGSDAKKQSIPASSAIVPASSSFPRQALPKP